MQKYCLEWQGDGSLDLSQVLDEHGVPVIFPRRGATAIVDARTFSHPHIQNYLKAGLKGTAVSPGAPRVIEPPASPVAPPPAPVTAPPVVPEVIAPPVVSDAPPKPEVVTVPLVDTVPLKEAEVVTTASEVDSTEPEASTDSKRRRGRGR